MKTNRTQRNAGRYRHEVTIMRQFRAPTHTVGSKTTNVYKPIGKVRAFIDGGFGTDYYQGIDLSKVTINFQSTTQFYIEMYYFELEKTDHLIFKDPKGKTLEVNINEMSDDIMVGRYMRLMCTLVKGGELVPTESVRVMSSIVEDTTKNLILVEVGDLLTDSSGAVPLKNDFSVWVGSSGVPLTPKEVKLDKTDTHKLYIIMDQDFTENDVIEWAYHGNNTLHSGLKELSKQKIAVTNKIHHGHPVIIQPHVLHSVIEDTEKKRIKATYNEPMKASLHALRKAINIKINGGNSLHPINIIQDANRQIFYFYVNQPFKNSDVVTWEYDDSVQGADLRNDNDVGAENQTYGVTNEIIFHAETLSVVSAVIEDTAPDKIILTIDHDFTVGSQGEQLLYFFAEIDGKVTHPKSFKRVGTSKIIQLGFDTFINGQNVKLSYGTSDHVKGIVSKDDVLLSFQNIPVTNNVTPVSGRTVYFEDDFTTDNTANYTFNDIGTPWHIVENGKLKITAVSDKMQMITIPLPGDHETGELTIKYFISSVIGSKQVFYEFIQATDDHFNYSVTLTQTLNTYIQKAMKNPTFSQKNIQKTNIKVNAHTFNRLQFDPNQCDYEVAGQHKAVTVWTDKRPIKVASILIMLKNCNIEIDSIKYISHE